MTNASSEDVFEVALVDEGQPVSAEENTSPHPSKMKPSASFIALALEEGGQPVSAGGPPWRKLVYVPGPNTPKREDAAHTTVIPSRQEMGQ